MLPKLVRQHRRERDGGGGRSAQLRLGENPQPVMMEQNAADQFIRQAPLLSQRRPRERVVPLEGLGLEGGEALGKLFPLLNERQLLLVHFIRQNRQQIILQQRLGEGHAGVGFEHLRDFAGDVPKYRP